jgi:hypothetical protein
VKTVEADEVNRRQRAISKQLTVSSVWPETPVI